MTLKKRKTNSNIFILLSLFIASLTVIRCSPGELCTQQCFANLSPEQKKNAEYFIDADVVYRNNKFKPKLFLVNDVNEFLYVRMTKIGKYVKEGNSTTFAWMKNGKRIMEGDPRVGGSYDEVPCHTIEIAFSENIHLIFESILDEKYTLKTVLYQGVDVQNSENPLGAKYSSVYYMKDVDLHVQLASE